MSSSRNIESFSWVIVDDEAGIIESTAGVNWNDVEKLTEGVGVEIFISEDTFKADSFISFWWSFKEEMISSFFDFEQLISTLLSESEFDFVPFFIPDKIGLAVDDFIVIVWGSNFFDHP